MLSSKEKVIVGLCIFIIILLISYLSYKYNYTKKFMLKKENFGTQESVPTQGISAGSTIYNSTISAQGNIINLLNNTISDLLSSTIIKTSTTTKPMTTTPMTTTTIQSSSTTKPMTTKPMTTQMIKSNFANIDSQNSIIFPPNSNPEINNYVNSYNKGIALLEDPNEMTKSAFQTYIHIQNKRINDLNKNLENLNKDLTKKTPPVKGLKSMFNSKILNVEDYPNPTDINNGMSTTYSGNGSTKYPNYLIYGNNGCLQYEQSSNLNDNTPSWSFKSCNSNDQKQQFAISQINTLNQYNKLITDKNNSNYLLNNDSSTQFGFYVVNPNSVNDQCLQLNNDGLSVMPCTMDTSQRFRPVYHNVIE